MKRLIVVALVEAMFWIVDSSIAVVKISNLGIILIAPIEATTLQTKWIKYIVL